MRQDMAEIVALQALGWLASSEHDLGAFLAQSGMGAESLTELAGSTEFLAAVMDFVLESDARALAVAAMAGLRPEMMSEVRAALPGGDLPHWT
ncbi:MAG: DUF3572 family protein [Rhodobacteraceae bacterium]|nr:DUF3572 family protein [Paracoccaceae bacterium]